ncbi:MAG: cell division protein FtsQ/DivIB [Candidatus Rariloculaceae bacterium]
MKRARVNRRKTAKQRQSSILPKARINFRAILLPSLLIASVAGALLAGQILLDRPVGKLQIEGSFQRVTPIQVEAAVSPVLGFGFLSSDLSEIRQLVSTLDWVDEVEVVRIWPDTLVVRIWEHEAAARWGDKGLLNTHGVLFTDESRYEFPELPQLIGPHGVESEVANQYLVLRGRLVESNLSLDTLSMDERGAWLLKLNTGQEVRFGRRDVEQRINRFFDIAAPALASDMDRAEYIDLRYTNGFSVGWLDDMAIKIAGHREGSGG